MSLYHDHILPWLITRACSIPSIARMRDRVVPLAQGVVLEIGAGGGLNLRFYDRTRVRRVYGLDISEPLLDRARHEAARLGLPFDALTLDAATIPLPDAAVDTVLVTFTLCSIADLPAALSEMRRVLKPGGRLVFCEHGLAPTPGVARLQRLVEPVWKPLAGGCHLTRDPQAALRAAGFALKWVEQGYLPRAWRGVGYVSWGVAVPAP